MATQSVVTKLWVDRKGGVMSVDTTTLQIPVNSYLHSQQIPSKLWHIRHNLGYYPNVAMIDSANNLFYCEIQYISINEIIAQLAYAVSGKAICS
jgi:hypothetical protein